MSRKMSFFLFVVTLFCASISAMSQDFQSIRQKAERVVKIKRPDWKLLHRSEDEKQVFYSWGSAKKGITMLIFFGDSKNEAVDMMEFKNKILSVGPGKKRTDFGDEAYYSGGNRGESGHIRFRKANLYIEVTAPSLTLAEELARELIRPSNKK